MKVCTKCDKWKSDRDFYRYTKPGKTRDMLHPSCKECQREAAREWWRKKLEGRPKPKQKRDNFGRFCVLR